MRNLTSEITIGVFPRLTVSSCLPYLISEISSADD